MEPAVDAMDDVVAEPTHKLGIIYKFVCNKTNKLLYVGSTTKTLEHRLAQHRYNESYGPDGTNYRYVYKYISDVGWSNVSIDIVEHFPYQDVVDLRNREGYYIRLMKPEYNINIAGRTMKEYRDENKYELAEYSKRYRAEHKSEIAKYSKLYNQEHKAQHAEYMKQYMKQYRAKHRHENIQYERSRQYYQDNKAEIAERKKRYYEENKHKLNEPIECECGATISRQCLPRHRKSKLHISSMRAKSAKSIDE